MSEATLRDHEARIDELVDDLMGLRHDPVDVRDELQEAIEDYVQARIAVTVQHMVVGPTDLIVVTLRSASQEVAQDVLHHLERARPDLAGIPARLLVVQEDVTVDVRSV
jgi:hypothetical protein